MPNQLIPAVANAILPSDDLNDNWELIEDSFDILSPVIFTGLVQSAGTGLSVNVTAGSALIGMKVTEAGAFVIGSLTPSTTNHLYVLSDGTGTSNTTGTAPADSVKLGTATTDGSGVTAVATNWTSGRQALTRHENLVHGSGAGHPRAVDLASWHATNNEGNEVRGVLPSGALPTGGALLPVTSKTANYTATDSDYFIKVDSTSGAVTITLPAASGRTGKVLVIKKIDASANNVVVDGNASETIDGATTLTWNTQYASYSIFCDGTGWNIF